LRCNLNKEDGECGLDSSCSGYDPVTRCCELGYLSLCSVIRREFLDGLSDQVCQEGHCPVKLIASRCEICFEIRPFEADIRSFKPEAAVPDGIVTSTVNTMSQTLWWTLKSED